jgi:hypothetical protein
MPLLRIYENITGSFATSLPLPGFKTVVLYSSCAHLTSRRSLSGRCYRARSHDNRNDLVEVIVIDFDLVFDEIFVFDDNNISPV